MSLFNAHFDERCFLPIHVYDTASARPAALLLRSGAPPRGREIRNLVHRTRRHLPNTWLTIRGDGHYARPEVMAWREANAVRDILGLSGNAALHRWIEPVANETRVQRAVTEAATVRANQTPPRREILALPAPVSAPASRPPARGWTFATW